MSTALAPASIERAIRNVRGQRVILDEDIARLYGVPTGRLNEAVKRNQARFPADFMFRLTADEALSLKSQSATSKGRGGRRRSTPQAFTEQGVAMLASVLNSPRAIAVNIEIVRVFVRLRQAIALSAELARRLDAVEAKLAQQGAETGKRLADHERHIRAVFEAIRQLMAEPTAEPTAEPPRERIGFRTH